MATKATKTPSTIGTVLSAFSSIFRSSNHATSWLENKLAEYNMDSYNALKEKKAEFQLTREEIIELKQFRNELL